MLLQIHRSSPQPQKIQSWSPSALFPHFMKNSQLLLRPSEGPYENYFKEVRRHHVVFLEYTLQNFLLLQSNSLNKISKRKSQPFWLFSETGTSYNQLQMQQPPWFPIHFPKSKFDGLFLSKILSKRSWVQIYLFFPHLCFNIWKSIYFPSAKASPCWYHQSCPHSRLDTGFYLPHTIKPSMKPWHTFQNNSDTESSMLSTRICLPSWIYTAHISLT